MSNYNKDIVDYVVFSNKAPLYSYDEKNNILTIVGERDLQKEINDNLDCSLEAVISKYGFVPQVGNSFVDGEGVAEFYDDPKDKISQQFDIVEDIRERYNLPLDISDEALQKFIVSESSYLKGQLDNLNKKGGVVDETQKDLEESK